MGRLTTIAALSSLFVLGSNAQGDICENVKGFYNYDAYGDFDFTGFFSNADNIGPCECGPWKYSQKIINNGSAAVQNYYLDTQGATSGTETNAATGVCTEGLRVFEDNTYYFSKEVLQRSLGDEGDCKVMLGEQCADALKLHFLRESVAYIRAGACPGDGKVKQNRTVPFECAGLVGGGDEWFDGQMWAAATNPVDSLDKVNTDNSCPAIENPNEHSGIDAHLLGSVPVALNQAVRFPTPTFFTFFPNTEEARAELAANASRFDVAGLVPWTSSSWVQLSCIQSNVTMDIEVPSAEELLGRIPAGDAPVTVSAEAISTPTKGLNGTVSATPSCSLH
ncbi:hypothetical protein DPSP01_009676 [Paraphaeosphaeria sporulosa]